jgi:4-hydroxyphenylpyruvate dioxygenase-like putative hemolysin
VDTVFKEAVVPSATVVDVSDTEVLSVVTVVAAVSSRRESSPQALIRVIINISANKAKIRHFIIKMSSCI